MKKFLSVFFAVIVMAFFGACASTSTPEETSEAKTYDSDFIADLAKGLSERWDYADSPESLLETDQKESLTKAINIELETISKYEDLPFGDSMLKEKALSYINELNNGLTVLSSYGAESYYQDWASHDDSRKKLLVEINELSSLSFDDAHKSQFDEFVNRGLEVIQNNEKEVAMNELLNQFQFTAMEPDYAGSTFITYEATVENTTEFDFEWYSVSIDLLDADGIVMETQHCYVENWTAGKKVKTEFMTDAEFASIEVNLESF